MKLGLLTAAFPDLSLAEVAEWARSEGFETLGLNAAFSAYRPA